MTTRIHFALGRDTPDANIVRYLGILEYQILLERHSFGDFGTLDDSLCAEQINILTTHKGRPANGNFTIVSQYPLGEQLPDGTVLQTIHLETVFANHAPQKTRVYWV